MNVLASTLGGALFALAAVSLVAQAAGVSIPIALYIFTLVVGAGGGMLFAVRVGFPPPRMENHNTKGQRGDP